jgi:DeoR/GlpR family transcriptional regulator of sugar metabolism
MSVLKIDRHKHILQAISDRKRVSLSELESMVNASRITIQRDLVELEDRHLLRRFHGGAMTKEYAGNFYDHSVRKTVNVDVKRKIAEKAVQLVHTGSHIAMDASSTVYYMSECMFPENVHVVTLGVDTFSRLSEQSRMELILAGGRLNRMTNTLSGPEAVEVIRKYHFDLVFISAEALVPGFGFVDPYADEIMVKRALMESSEKSVILLDSSKIYHTAGLKLCAADDVDYLITDSPSDKELRKTFKGRIL